MYPKIMLSLLFTLIAASLSSQTPASATLSANRVKAQFNANGAMFTDFQKGQFIAPYAPGQPEISLIRAAGLWIAGVDPAYNLKGAVQLYNTNGKSDFFPGVLDNDGLPPFPPPGGSLSGMYRVTAAEIAAHLADLADNGQIDNPQPGVFGWPALGNPFFSQYHNGEELPQYPRALAGFFDHDGDGVYNPTRGDYPVIEVRGCALDQAPSEMLWFAFNDSNGFPHTQSNTAPLQMEVQCQVFAFNCLEDSPLRDAVFVRFKLVNLGTERLDSLFVGLFNDFDIGNPNDDFFGCDTSRSIVFGYNGDNFDEGAFGAEAPVIAADMFRGPLDTFGQEIPLKHVVAFNPADLTGAEVYYRLLSGSLADGSPAPGNGILYPGNPNDPAADSEVSAGNTPGQRYVLASYGPFSLLPGAVNELITGYFFTQQPGATPLQNVQAMYARADAIQAFFDNCFMPTDQIACSPVSSAPALHAPAAGLNIFPNPASQTFAVESEKTGITRVQLTDLAGRTTFSQYLAGTTLRVNIPIAELPAGVYLAEIWLENGARGWEKVVVSR